MIIHTFEQGTDEWHAIRLGKFTASQAQAIATAGEGLDTLVLEKVTELLTGKRSNTFKSKSMERGNELEAEAREVFAFVHCLEIETVGFYELNEFVGGSPDGLTSDGGNLEIKCPDDKTFTQYLLDGVVDTAYMWQMQMQMMLTGRKFCYYVVYNPNFSDPMIVKKIERDEEKITKIMAGLDKGIADVKAKLKKIKERKR